MKYKRIQFTVVGSRPFPFDMLRYDGCYPTGPGDAEAIRSSSTRVTRADQARNMLEIRLQSDRESTTRVGPTEGRWNSFGWYVKDVDRYS